MMDARQVLTAAADHIEKYGIWKEGWVPNRYVDLDTATLNNSHCPACVGGAIALVISGGVRFSPNCIQRPSERQLMVEAFDLLIEHLKLPRTETEDRRDTVVYWSDASTQEEVVAGLRAAAG